MIVFRDKRTYEIASVSYFLKASAMWCKFAWLNIRRKDYDEAYYCLSQAIDVLLYIDTDEEAVYP